MSVSDLSVTNSILWQRVTSDVRTAEVQGELLKQARSHMNAAGIGTPAALAWWTQVRCNAADVAATLASARTYASFIQHDVTLQNAARKLIDKTRKSIPTHD